MRVQQQVHAHVSAGVLEPGGGGGRGGGEHACYLGTDGCLQECFDATVEDGGGGSGGVHSAMREGATFAAAAGAAAPQPLAAW